LERFRDQRLGFTGGPDSQISHRPILYRHQRYIERIGCGSCRNVAVALWDGEAPIGSALDRWPAEGAVRIARIHDPAGHHRDELQRHGRRQFEHRPAAIRAARGGRAVEIAGGIEDQAGRGISPVRAVAEAMQHFLRPAPARLGRQLEHQSQSVQG
jgi:hypothetical protein